MEKGKTMTDQGINNPLLKGLNLAALEEATIVVHYHDNYKIGGQWEKETEELKQYWRNSVGTGIKTYLQYIKDNKKSKNNE